MASVDIKVRMGTDRSYCYHPSLEDRCSFWNTYLDSGNALVRAHTYLYLTGCRKQVAVKPVHIQSEDENAKCAFSEDTSKHLSDHDSNAHPEETWCDIKSAVETAVKTVGNLHPKHRKRHLN
ncbi:unnamed protein product [Heterobilharzia americana]|nr:unnamed protein product [Heterobilharzia americana]